MVDADALLVRSVTKVDAFLLHKATRLKFVGSTTSGIEHIDTHFLQQHNIAFSAARGSNANAVAEYVISCLLALEAQKKCNLAASSLGIIGMGQVGSRLAAKAAALGLRILSYDPPRARIDRTFELFSR